MAGGGGPVGAALLVAIGLTVCAIAIPVSVVWAVAWSRRARALLLPIAILGTIFHWRIGNVVGISICMLVVIALSWGLRKGRNRDETPAHRPWQTSPTGNTGRQKTQ